MARVDALERTTDRHDNRIGILERITPTIDEQKDSEQRLRSLEALRWQLIGAASGFALLGSLLGPLIRFWLTGK